jgi:hypothetical protein
MKILCAYQAGSHAYGLDTPDSDSDVRGVFALTLPGCIIDPHQYDSARSAKYQGVLSGKTDTGYYELRHFFNILRQGNTNAIEMLFVEDWAAIDPFFLGIIQRRAQLLDSEQIYKSLKGYMFGELKKALGERTGKLGGKRKETVDKYGFSPKNFVQLLRLAHCGIEFFETGMFPVHLGEDPIRAQLLDIKTNPANYSKIQLTATVHAAELELERAYKNRSFNTQFNQRLADRLMIDCYLNVLQNHASQPGKKAAWKRFLGLD